MFKFFISKRTCVAIVSLMMFGYVEHASAELVINPYPLKSGAEMQAQAATNSPAVPAMPQAEMPDVSLKMEAPVDITAPPENRLLPPPSESASLMPSAYVDYGTVVSQIEPSAGAGIPIAQPQQTNVLGSIDKYNLVAIGARPAAAQRTVSSSKSYGIIAPEGPLWYAAYGADLQSTLKNWSDRAGVQVVWDAYGRFSVPGKFEFGGQYEEAVSALLEGYKGQTRPVANLYIDPHTGAQTLVIQVGSS